MHKRRVYQTEANAFETAPQLRVGTAVHTRSQKIKIIQLLPVPHDVALDLAGVDPGHKVLHIASHQEGRVSDNLSSDTDMALFDKCSSLSEPG